MPACVKSGAHVEQHGVTAAIQLAEKAELATWRRQHSWHPHQLRHNAGTHIRREFGIEAARLMLGHRSLDVTEVYAEADHQKVQDVVRKIG